MRMLISGDISQVPYDCKGIVSSYNSFYIQNIRKAFENIFADPISFPNIFSAQGPLHIRLVVFENIHI